MDAQTGGPRDTEDVQWPLERVLLVLPYLFGVLTFAAMLGNQFWLDDYGWVSTAVRAIDDPRRILDTQAGFFRPLVNLSFLINYLIFDLQPSGYYLVNLLLHLVNVSLVIRLCLRLTGGRKLASGLAGLLFAGAVGSYGEAVFWISGRTELIAVGFYLATLLAFVRYLDRQRMTDYLVSLCCFGLALLSKESAVSALPVLVVLELTWDRDGGLVLVSAMRWLRYIPFLAVLAPYALYEWSVQRSNIVVEQSSFRIGWHVFPNLLEYLTLMVVPLTRSSTVVDVSGGVGTAVGIVQVVVGGVLVIGWIAVVVHRRTTTAMRFAIVWMVLAILPYAFFTTKTTARYLYLPSIGFVIAVALLLDAAVRRYGVWLRAHPAVARTGIIALGALLAVQWVVVNYVINQWAGQQAGQDPELLDGLRELSRSVGR